MGTVEGLHVISSTENNILIKTNSFIIKIKGKYILNGLVEPLIHL